MARKSRERVIYITKADGTVYIETLLDTKGIARGAADIKSQFGTMGNAVKKLGAAIGVAFGIQQIVQFGKEAIELGSDLQEVQNVVDVTFGSMNGTINSFAQNAITQFGLSELAAKQYTSTMGAMLKSMGFATDQAAVMSMELSGLAGDMASFYNLDPGEAFAKIRAGISGETEPLKQLGINLSVANLEAFALAQGITKSYNAMSQQEQTMLRYNYLLSVTADAQGDFARTSNSWANQTRILSEQFNSLKATIGQGLINAFTPVLKVINTVLAGLQAIANAFKQLTAALFGSAAGSGESVGSTAQAAADGYSAAADNAEEFGNEAEKAGKKVQKSLAGFDEITKLSETEASGGSGSSGAESGSYGGLSDLDIAVGGDVTDNISPKILAIVEKIKALIAPLQEIDFSKAKVALQNFGNTFLELGGVIVDALEWAWFNILVPLSSWAIEDVAPATVDALSAGFNMLKAALAPVIDGLKQLFNWLRPVFNFVGDTVLNCIDTWRSLFAKLAATFEEKGEKIRGIISGVGEIFAAVWAVLEPELAEMRNTWRNTFEILGDVVDEAVGLIIDLLHGAVEYVAGVFTGDWKRALNGIIGGLNGVISSVVKGINALINALNTLSFKIPDWVPSYGGKSFGFNIKTLTAPQIPYLAHGAVIPPNAPFMAVLGDQRHGTNIEAPVSTIQEAVAVVMEDYAASNLAGHEATVAVLRDILEAVMGIEIGDEVIGNAAARYERRRAIMRGQ